MRDLPPMEKVPPSHFASVYWSVWFAAWFIAFLAYETFGLVSGHPENTLSASVWHWLGVMKGQPITQWSASHFLFAGVFSLTAVWLVGHFIFGEWT